MTRKAVTRKGYKRKDPRTGKEVTVAPGTTTVDAAPPASKPDAKKLRANLISTSQPDPEAAGEAFEEVIGQKINLDTRSARTDLAKAWDALPDEVWDETAKVLGRPVEADERLLIRRNLGR